MTIAPQDVTESAARGRRWAEAPDLLTPTEVARLLRISRTSCYESLRSGVLRPTAIRWGRKYLICKSSLHALVEKEGE